MCITTLKPTFPNLIHVPRLDVAGAIGCEGVDVGRLVGNIRDVVRESVRAVLSGEKVVLVIGEVGSGKTTVLRMVACELGRLGVP